MRRKLITTAAAAAIINCSERHARHLLAKGTVKGEKQGRDWLALESSVLRYGKLLGLGLIKTGPKPRKRRKARK